MPDHHELEKELEEQLARTAKFRRMAFHVHSPESYDWGKEADRDKNDRARFEGSDGMDTYLDALAEHLDIVCITDHMKSRLACELSRRAEERHDLELVVFPGVGSRAGSSPTWVLSLKSSRGASAGGDARRSSRRP